MEEDCQLLESCLVTTDFMSRVYSSSLELNSDPGEVIEGLISKSSAGRIAGAISIPGSAGWGEPTSPDQKSFPRVQSVTSNNQRAWKRVLLYCFRFGDCGTFMPLSIVQGEFRIAVVWTLLVAAFSASSVHFRLLLAAAFSLSAVKAVCAAE